MSKIICAFILGFLTSCLANRRSVENSTEFAVSFDSLVLLDHSRNREVPIAIYKPQTGKIKNRKLVIVNHGYFANRSGANKEYSYLTGYLASKGYFVISIQHELPTDSLIPDKGLPQIVRRPFWERGVENILFVINESKKKYPELDYGHVALIGHSNGGDMAMLFGQEHSALVDKIISLDNRRMALPRTKQPKIYSLRSSDQPADVGVLPTAEEQKKYGIKIIKLNNTAHNNMDNSGTEEQKKEISSHILTFLND